MRKLFTLIQILLVAALVVFIIFLNRTDSPSDTPLSDMDSAVTSVLDMSAFEDGTNLMLKKYYGLNADDYEGAAYHHPVSGMSAEELLIIKLKDESQAEAVADAMDEYARQKGTAFEGYAPEQYSLVENRQIITKGNYVMLVIHPDASKAVEAFNAAY